MKRHIQRHLAERSDGHSIDGIAGNCLQTAVASMLDLEVDEVPHFATYTKPWCHSCQSWAEHVAARIVQARAEWPCANYQSPLTCLTAPATTTGRCDFCATQARAGEGALRERVEEWLGRYDLGSAECRPSVLELRAALTDTAGDPT